MTTAAPSFNLRDKQIKCISKMLSIKSSEENASVDQWKILIYDTDCRDIISPLMNVSALHQHGVTLYLLVLSPCSPMCNISHLP